MENLFIIMVRSQSDDNCVISSQAKNSYEYTPDHDYKSAKDQITSMFMDINALMI